MGYYNHLLIDITYLDNCKKPSAGELNNVKNHFLYLIHHKFKNKYQNQPMSAIIGGDNQFLFYTGVEGKFQNLYQTTKPNIIKWLEKMLASPVDITSLKMVKVKHVSKSNQKTSLLSFVYVHEIQSVDQTNNNHNEKDFTNYYCYYLFPVYLGDLHE